MDVLHFSLVSVSTEPYLSNYVCLSHTFLITWTKLDIQSLRGDRLVLTQDYIPWSTGSETEMATVVGSFLGPGNRQSREKQQTYPPDHAPGDTRL